MVRCLAREIGSTSEAHLQHLSGVNVVQPEKCSLFAVIVAPIEVSVGSSRLSLRETALCWSPLTDRVGVWPLVRCVAQKPLNAWMEWI